MQNLIRIIEIKHDLDKGDVGRYMWENGYTMQREEGLTPVGNIIGRRWVLRDSEGEFVDVDQYRHDIMDRYNLAAEVA